MARSLNKCQIIGHLGKDPEVRILPSGQGVANFRVATTDQWKDKAGEKQESTEWFNVAISGPLSEVAGKYLKKGSKAYFEGSLRTRKWQDKDGGDRYTTELIAKEMLMLDPPTKSRDDAPAAPAATGRNSSRGTTSSIAKLPGARKPADRARRAEPKPLEHDDEGDFDDDIPIL